MYDVWHTFYEWAQPVYVDLQPMIEGEGSSFSDQYSDLRHLVRRMDDIQLKRMHAQNANHWALWTPERILDYYQYELESGKQNTRRRRSRTKKSIATPQEVRDEMREEADVAGGK